MDWFTFNHPYANEGTAGPFQELRGIITFYILHSPVKIPINCGNCRTRQLVKNNFNILELGTTIE